MSVKGILAIVLGIALGSSAVSALPGGGTISGKVSVEGTPAKPLAIDMSKEPDCAKQHATPILTENVVVGPGNALENVVVYISEGAPDETSAASEVVSVIQKGCQYLPHVVPPTTSTLLPKLIANGTKHSRQERRLSLRSLIKRSSSQSSATFTPGCTQPSRS
jgi:hypothetical protein